MSIDIGNRVEMMIDDALIEKKSDLAFRLNNPIEFGMAIKADKPWEGWGSFAYISVLKLDNRYLMYYRASVDLVDDTDPNQYLCVAFSEDGVHWTKPELDICPYKDCRYTNILMSGEEWGAICHNFTPVLDTNPNCKADERIKAVGGHAPDGLFVFCSSDGLRFRKFVDTPAITGTLLDSQNVLIYDEVSGVYRIYSRYLMNGLRAIRCCTSSDLIHWSGYTENRYSNGVQKEHLYTNATTPCPGAEHILLSMPMRFVPGRKRKLVQGEEAISDSVFMTSRDGTLWDRRFMGSWIAGGLDEKRWTQRNNMPARGILDCGDSFYVYAGAHYCWTDAYIDGYKIRKFGFASLSAEDTEGFFETKPLVFRGKELKLNYKTAATGWIRVELASCVDGRPLEGFSFQDCEEIYGDALKETVQFRGGSLENLRDQTAILKVKMRLADLFAFQFE